MVSGMVSGNKSCSKEEVKVKHEKCKTGQIVGSLKATYAGSDVIQ